MLIKAGKLDRMLIKAGVLIQSWVKSIKVNIDTFWYVYRAKQVSILWLYSTQFAVSNGQLSQLIITHQQDYHVP